jgi:hypothetical protein
MIFAACSAAAGCGNRLAVTEPCDLLVRMDPRPETNGFIVERDRTFAQAVAMHRGRYTKWRCAE